MDAREMLEVSVIHSVAGMLTGRGLTSRRPFRDPHPTLLRWLPWWGAAATRAKPGEVSLAHNGVLFLDELPEFPRAVLDSLRQPLEVGHVTVARANGHVTYPARVQLVAAMNPCKCGHLGDPTQGCSRAPHCGRDYQARLSGPLLDRIDLQIEVPAVEAGDLSLPPPTEGSAEIAARVAAARAIQPDRYNACSGSPTGISVTSASTPPPIRSNATADGELLSRVASPDAAGARLLVEAAERMRLTARGYHRVLRVARTLADLDGIESVGRLHIAEALSYRRMSGFA